MNAAREGEPWFVLDTAEAAVYFVPAGRVQ
jgi:hypothetical protein